MQPAAWACCARMAARSFTPTPTILPPARLGCGSRATISSSASSSIVGARRESPASVRMRSLTVPAPAKLNLFLHVTGRRGDGYHLLETLMVALDTGDTITLTRRD